MTELRLSGNPEITIQLRRNARARRLSLRVSQLDGRVTLTLPRAASQSEASGFAREKESWIRKQLGRRSAETILTIGAKVLFQGVELPIVAGEKRTVQLLEDQLMVPGDPKKVAIRLAAFMKLRAREQLSRACDDYAGRLGKQVRRITLRDTRSRWGSCTCEGNLMFSWRLIMAPPDVLDYVAAHEVAHLIEMNHSADFWAQVARVYPDYQRPRQWLRQNGAQLHSYRFSQLTP